MTTLLRLRAVMVVLALTMLVVPKPFRRELVSCFERLDDEAKSLKLPAPSTEAAQ